MFYNRLLAITSTIILGCISSIVVAADSPTIMVSIKPFYNLCAKIMHNVGKPELLVKWDGSPHDYQLKPSDAKLINSSDLVIWGGIGIDGYLAKSIETLGQNKELDLSTIKDLKLLPLRTSLAWHTHDHDHDHSHAHYDAHFWLDPNNAILIGQAIADRLAKLDPKHAKVYQQNAQNLRAQILAQQPKWLQQLQPYHHIPYLVFHDAYQYFNDFFKLNGVGAISLNPEVPPSARRIEQIQTLLKEEKVDCIFSEPQFNYKIIDSLTTNLDIYKGVLDPLGQEQDLGPGGYLILIDKLVSSFVQCGKSQ